MTYSYDAAGRRAAFSDPTGVTSLTRDGVGRITSVTSPSGNLSYTWDLAGQLTATARPDGTVSQTYDAAGRISTISEPTGTVTQVEWRGDDQLATLMRPNGVTTTYDYDTAGRLVGVHHDGPTGSLVDYTSELDANGNRTSLTIDDGTNPRTETYELDVLDRLLSVTGPDGTTEQYEYDAAGNITTSVLDNHTPVTTTFEYDAAQQLISRTSGGLETTYQYDAAGNTVSSDGPEGTATYQWDSQSQLVRTTTSAADIEYRYSADGVRTEVDGTPQLWDRVSGGLPVLVDDGTSTYVHGPDGVLTGTSGGVVLSPLADPLGSFRTFTNDQGVIAGTTTYSAHGEAATSGTVLPFGYTGELLDETGLQYLRARSYDPQLGRFLSPDTLQPSGQGTGGWNQYTYVRNNPTTYVDPTGHLDTGGALKTQPPLPTRTPPPTVTTRQRSSGDGIAGYAALVAAAVAGSWFLVRGGSYIRVALGATSCLQGSGSHCFGTVDTDPRLETETETEPDDLPVQIKTRPTQLGPCDADVDYLINRADFLHLQHDVNNPKGPWAIDTTGDQQPHSLAFRRSTTAVVRGESLLFLGLCYDVVGGSGNERLRNYIRRELLPFEAESFLTAKHAEITALGGASALLLRPLALGSSRPICGNCQHDIYTTYGGQLAGTKGWIWVSD